jgi:hypothetical protein
MAHATLISLMRLNACGKVPDHLAAGRVDLLASRPISLMAATGRTGCIDVVWVAHLSSTVRLSADAMVEMGAAFDELEPKLRARAAGQLRGHGADWEFERRQGGRRGGVDRCGGRHPRYWPGQSVVIVVGSSSHATHRMVGSVAVSLARHPPVPLVIVP